jgi:hypothetical protein
MRRILVLAGAWLWLTALASAQDNPYGSIADLKLQKPEDGKDAPSTPPPAGAIVLFDGKSLDGWTKRDGKSPPTWKLTGGAMQAQKGGGDIISKEKFDGSFKLHVEFRVPYQPNLKGQARGNSGVYLQGRYEVQVLDSYGLKSGGNDCGAIYGVAAPAFNACKAPTVWQTYDIEFQAPTCQGGKKIAPGVMTVYHNTVKIHDKVKITSDNTTSGAGGDVCTPGPILLQDHGDPVQYRNIWVVKQ